MKTGGFYMNCMQLVFPVTNGKITKYIFPNTQNTKANLFPRNNNFVPDFETKVILFFNHSSSKKGQCHYKHASLNLIYTSVGCFLWYLSRSAKIIRLTIAQNKYFMRPKTIESWLSFDVILRSSNDRYVGICRNKCTAYPSDINYVKCFLHLRFG